MNIPTIQPTTDKREHLDTLSAGAILPFMQATLLALVVFIVTWLVCDVVFRMMDAHRPAVLFASLAWAWMLLKLFRHWLNRTAVQMTTIIKDIADDGLLNNSVKAPAASEAEPRVVRIQLTHIKDGGHIQQENFDLPGDEYQLSTLAKGLLDGMAPFTERYWVRQQKLYSREMFDDLREKMRERDEPLAEYIDPKNKQQGMRLTDAGKDVMRNLSALPHSPTEESEA